jgi:hypothetical protein
MQEEREERDEANRIGGNYLKVRDPTCPPYTPFYLMVTGHI